MRAVIAVWRSRNLRSGLAQSEPMMSPPLSLYVHLPWCVRKCPYCDFNSYSTENAPKARYIDALTKDIQQESEFAGERQLISVFFGGGTPSLFSPDEIAQILGEVDKQFSLAEDIEITMEANPGSVECGDPADYRAAGVNRLSIGAQSFSATQLKTLGRVHGVDDIARAVDEAHAAGFENINLDIMHALPGQTVDDAIADLEAAIALGPQHVSWYQLTLEPNTVFHARPPDDMPGHELAWDIQQAGQALLASNDYEQYEVSAYARDGRQCRHNLNYWSFGDYLAVGAGAHGKVTLPDGIYRYAKPANPMSYMNEAGLGAVFERSKAQRERAMSERNTPSPAIRVLSDDELIFEYMLNAVLLTSGFHESDFESRTGLGADALAAAADWAQQRSLIRREDTGLWHPTTLGWRFLNDLQADFLPE